VGSQIQQNGKRPNKATAAAGQQPNGEIQREQMTVKDQAQKNADFTGSQRSELKNAESTSKFGRTTKANFTLFTSNNAIPSLNPKTTDSTIPLL
jgi:hypothetical protein